jgi:hypothetical protein
MRKFGKAPILAAAAASLAVVVWVVVTLYPASEATSTPIDLGDASSFAVLAGTGITNTGATSASGSAGGDFGSSPTPAFTGFGTVDTIGTKHLAVDPSTIAAKVSLDAAYADAVGREETEMVTEDLGGRVLTHGVYNSVAAIGIVGTLTLDAQGDPDAVFLFQAGSTLVTAVASEVVLINGAQSCNVFWQVGSSATIGVNSIFAGHVLAFTSITTSAGATVNGSLLAKNGAVTLDTNTFVNSACVLTWNVIFDANGGAGSMPSQKASTSTALETNTYIRSGFNFVGWNTASDGSGRDYADGSSYDFESDETLYAQWTATATATPSSTPTATATPSSAPVPAPVPVPLETSAPAPTTPTETVQAPSGSVEGSNQPLKVVSNAEDGSMMVSGSDWQLEVASKQKTGNALPANNDQRLVFQPETRFVLAAEGLMPESAVAFWVFSKPTFAGEVQTDISGKFESNLELPDGLAPGDHTLQVLSRDSGGRVITLNFPITVAEKVAQKVNAGSFKGFVAIYAKGYEGQRLSAKVGKDWVIVASVPAARNNLFRRLESVGTGVDVAVRIYIDRVLVDTINLTTR